MIQFRRMEMFLFVMSVLLLTAAQQHSVSSFIVREGDAVTLPCKNVISGQVKCGWTTWTFNHFINSGTVEVIKLGESRSDRVRVTADCSLTIKRVTEEDVGRYYCQQYKPGNKVDLHSEFYLSLVHTTEHADDDTVTLTCSLRTYRQHTLRWLYNGAHLVRNTRDIQISSPSSTCSALSPCSITANFMTSNEKYKEQLKCEVTDSTAAVQVFSFTHQSSGRKADETKKSATPTTTTTSATSPDSNTETNNTLSVLLPYVSGGAGLGALLLAVVLICYWKRRHKLPKDDIGLSPAVSNPGANQNMTHPDDEVAYASISHAQQMKTNDKARFRRNPHGEDDAVTYAAVNISSSPAAALSDPTNLYASVNKENT
ncbi:uncharacterized protein LOC143004096 isoform X2 [Genypterus blacodes]|uniref:uncharacterized protein LOC143004096 isoform X2 n=1 Tax=Genypterus blacodes TaxID=154954 RepID=UPI003F7601EC